MRFPAKRSLVPISCLKSAVSWSRVKERLFDANRETKPTRIGVLRRHGQDQKLFQMLQLSFEIAEILFSALDEVGSFAI